jgi:hypothetical protein
MEFVRDFDSGAGHSNCKSMKSLHMKRLMLLFSGSIRIEQKERQSLDSCGQEANFFHEALGLEGEFNASMGWLTRFKQRYGIHEIAVQGERLSTNDAAADMFIEFQKFVQGENLKLDQLYNTDESGLY